MRWLKNAVANVHFLYQLASRRFVVRVLQSDEIASAIALRRNVFGEELHRAGRGTQISPGDADSSDDKSTHLGCFDTRNNELVGALRITPASLLIDMPDYVKEYHLHLLDAPTLPHAHIPSRLAVRASYRRSPAGLLLTNLSYELGLRLLDSWGGIITAEPALYRLYLRFGWRPCGPCFNSALGGYRVPMFLVNHDYANLAAAKSPFLRIARRLGFPKVTGGIEWAQRQQLNTPINPGIALCEPKRWKEYPCQLFKGMSARGCRELLNGAVHIHTHMNDRVIAKGDGGEQPGFVVRGALQVVDDGQVVHTITPGMVFGEFAPILRSPRTADVIVADPDTELILFRRHAFEDVSSAHDRAILWKNLATSLVHVVLGR